MFPSRDLRRPRMALDGVGQAVLAQPVAGQHGEREEPIGVAVERDHHRRHTAHIPTKEAAIVVGA
jgi:hypothetical protein